MPSEDEKKIRGLFATVILLAVALIIITFERAGTEDKTVSYVVGFILVLVGFVGLYFKQIGEVYVKLSGRDFGVEVGIKKNSPPRAEPPQQPPQV